MEGVVSLCGWLPGKFMAIATDALLVGAQERTALDVQELNWMALPRWMAPFFCLSSNKK